MERIEWMFDHIILLIFTSMVLFSVFGFIHVHSTHKKEMDRIELMEKRILIKIDDRQDIDSLYHEHLSKCAFVSKYELKMDSRGYFYSAYKRNPNN